MEIASILKNACEKNGYTRSKYIEKNIPTSIQNISVLPFWGDINSNLILSSILLKRYREEVKGSKYFIMCSYPGQEGLFPYVDEYWTFKEEMSKKLYLESNGFKNNSNMIDGIYRGLNHYFEDVIELEDLNKFYSFGVKDEFFNKFKHIKKFIPAVPSSAILGMEFNKNLIKNKSVKVFVMPMIQMHSSRNEGHYTFNSNIEFWYFLIDELIKNGFCPVICQNYLTHKIFKDNYLNDCVYLNESNLLNIMAAMRATGLVLDIFNYSSKLAIAARTPYLSCIERICYNKEKEYEFDDLINDNNNIRKYLYSFSNIIENGDKNIWNGSIVDLIINSLQEISVYVDRNNLPSASEVEEIIPYSKVKINKNKKLGIKFIKTPKGD